MKLKRLFFLILGCVCLALGCVGIVLPVLPTVPFFLATVFCLQTRRKAAHMVSRHRALSKTPRLIREEKGHDRADQDRYPDVRDAADGRRLFPDAAKSALHSLHYSRYCVALPPLYFLFGVKTIKTECEEQI